MELTPEIRASRIALARDLLAELEAGQLHCDTGNYFDQAFDLELPRYLSEARHHEVEVPVVLKYCHVCATAALLMTHLLRQARPFHLAGGFYDEEHAIIDGLAGIFDLEALALIEAAFEGGTNKPLFEQFIDHCETIEQSDRFELAAVAAAVWFDIFIEEHGNNANKRVAAIAHRIIADDGEVTFS